MAAFGGAQVVLNVVAIIQFVWLLFTSNPNRFVLRSAPPLSVWLADVGRFLQLRKR